MLRKIKAALMGGVAALALSATAANATLHNRETTSHGWEINYSDTSGSCSTRRDHTDGTRFVMIYEANGTWTMIIGDPSWGSSIVEGNTYQVTHVIDGRSFQSRQWVGRANSGGSFIVLTGVRTEFVRAWANGYRMELWSNGRFLTALWLDGTMDAVLRVIACQQDGQQGR